MPKPVAQAHVPQVRNTSKNTTAKRFFYTYGRQTVCKRSYLIPQAFLESRIPLIYTVDDNTVHSTATHSFAPPLHLPDRVPFQISLDSELPCKIHALSELLSSDKYDQVANAPATNRLVRNYGILQDFCDSDYLVEE